MASLLRDLTDMGIAVNPDVQSETVQQTKTKVVSIFESHWEQGAGLTILHLLSKIGAEIKIGGNLFISMFMLCCVSCIIVIIHFAHDHLCSLNFERKIQFLVSQNYSL